MSKVQSLKAWKAKGDGARDDFMHDTATERKLIASTINDLLEYRRTTHPDGGAITEAEKNQKAEAALRTAADLFSLLAGWAVDHVVGAAVADPSGDQLDGHSHEARGRKDVDATWSDEAVQRASKALIDILADVAKSRLSKLISCQMQAVMVGEHAPLFAPISMKRGGAPLTLWELRERAVGHVHYLVALRYGKTEARKLVAKAYGEASFENVRSWESRLPAVFSRRRYERLVERAHSAGSLAEHYSAEDEHEARLLAAIMTAEFDRAALEQNGRSYRLALARSVPD